MRNVVIVLIVIVLSACSVVPTTTALVGDWESTDQGHDIDMVASFTEDGMTIHFAEEDGTRILYWKGTAPNTVDDGETFVSVGDTDAMEFAILASTLDEKEFTYKDGHIVYDYGILGVTFPMILERK